MHIDLISSLHSSTLIGCGWEPNQSECLVLGMCRACRVHKTM